MSDPNPNQPPQPGQPPYGQPPYGQQPYGQPPYGQPPYGQPPYGYGPYNPGIDKHLGWFIVNWIFLWPLAIYSLVSAWQNIDRALFAGDVAGAHYQASRVRKFGIIALCVGIGWITLVIVLDVVVFTTLSDHFDDCRTAAANC